MPRKKWTKEEIRFLKKNYKKLSNKELAISLNRTPMSIFHRLRKLGIYRIKLWSNKETSFLKKNYKTMKYEDIARLLNRSKGSIKGKLYELNLIKLPLKRWTEEEINILKENYKKMDNLPLCKLLPNDRSSSSITHKLKNLNLKRSPQLLKQFRINTGKKVEESKRNKNPSRYIQDKIRAGKMSISSIKKARELGIKSVQSQNRKISKPELLMKQMLPTDFLHNAQLGDYVPDFHSAIRKIVIEVDGTYWHSRPETIKRDEIRTKHFQSLGYKVFRFTDKDVNFLKEVLT